MRLLQEPQPASRRGGPLEVPQRGQEEQDGQVGAIRQLTQIPANRSECKMYLRTTECTFLDNFIPKSTRYLVPLALETKFCKF
jgi:hypothetical protein